MSRFYPEAIVENISGDKSRIKIGSGTHIRGELCVYPYSGGMRVGDNSYIGANSVLRSGEFINIGDNVLIAHNVTIIDSDSMRLMQRKGLTLFKKLIGEGHPKEKGSVITKSYYNFKQCMDQLWRFNS